MIKVLIADDHTLVRKGLKEILSETSDIVVADEASNGQEVLDKVSTNDYDVILLDLTMPVKSGLDILKQLREEKPHIHILVLSMHPEEQYAVRILRAGASGYLTKASATDELIEAIRKVSSGGKYISSTLAEKLALALEEGVEKPLHESLSDREYQVMCIIASGKTIKEIADELNLSINTVSTLRTRILKKMKMKNNAEITYYAIKNGLVG
jgi:DNA-binding NarL/FixJ family response regulator